MDNCVVSEKVKIVNPVNLYGCKLKSNVFVGPFTESIKYCEKKKCFKISLNCEEKLKKFYSLNGFENRQINMSRLV
tara:strand:- start:877 stop:1104 length:228 start_codon:yes stop_codon:yes gene_type:complete